MDDAALLHAFVRDRSESAFEQLVARYLPIVHTTALRRTRGDEHRAREVTQMVFSELAQKAARLVRHPALAAWLHQSTRWHAANLFRAERRRARHESAAAEHHEIMHTPDEPPSWENLRPVLDEALDSLRETDRDAVLQRYFMDRPFSAIGQKIGVSENAARMRVDRALESLRSALARHGVRSTAAALALALTNHAGAVTPSGFTSAAIATAACKTAAGGTIAAAAVQLLMTKLSLGIAATLAAVLSLILWQQEQANNDLTRELAALRVTNTPPALAPTSATPPANVPAPPPKPTLQDVEDEILAAAEFAVPLTAEQKERVRLDTIIRKGELDYEYATLFRELGLPAKTLDAFKTLIVERNQAIYDARALAKEEGLVPASLAEEKKVANSAVGDVDGRIAALIGTDGLAQLHEYLDLAPFRNIASVARQNATSYLDPEDYERVRDLARQVRKAAPDYLEQVYQNNGWPMNYPAAVRDAITAFLGDAPRPLPVSPLTDIDRRMAEIARDAILSGTLPVTAVSGAVASEYKAEIARRSAAAKP